MNRRKFFGYFSAISAAVFGGAAIGSIPAITYAKAGETDNWWNQDVYLNGKQVEYAYEADVNGGWVDSFIPNGNGLKFNFENEPLKIRKFGKVEIRERSRR